MVGSAPGAPPTVTPCVGVACRRRCSPPRVSSAVLTTSPNRRAPAWHQLSGRAPPRCRHRRLCAVVARPPGQSATETPPKQPCANVAQNQWQSTNVVPLTYLGAVVVRPPGHNATMALPSQPCASVAPTQRQSAAVVPPTYKCVVNAQPPAQRATMAPPGQPCADMAPAQRLKDFHSDAPPWCYS